MPEPTPFHERIAACCLSHEWRDWAGFLSPVVYGASHEYEYYAIRNAAALIDISPLYKYSFRGAEAEAALDRIMTRDIGRCAVGQVLYGPWCDEAGKILDDGTVMRLSSDHFRVTAAEPNFRYFEACAFGFEVEIEDESETLAALALQGPRSRAILEGVVEGVAFGRLPFFHLAEGAIAGIPVTVTRTGYTGDLGYELWIPREGALTVWDALIAEGGGHGITPVGLAALDIARIEAGLLLIDVDFRSARSALCEAQKSSPFELGLGWAVALSGKGDFIGKRALLAERAAPSPWCLVGIEVDWGAIERAFAEEGLPPLVAGRASRCSVPIYNRFGNQIGRATSSTFSPVLKKFVALATVHRDHAAAGARVFYEMWIEHRPFRLPAVVVKRPFFDPGRKRNG